MQPNPELLGLLQKITNPLEQVEIKLQVEGVQIYYIYSFNLPEEFKQDNENIQFDVNFFGVQVQAGKFQQRIKTAKEIREEEETVKKKKGGKEVQLTEEEQQAYQEMLKNEQQELEKYNAIYESLSEEEQQYMLLEDKFKNTSMQFKEDNAERVIDGRDLQLFEDAVYYEKQIKISLDRYPLATEEELVKLRKKAPKGLQPGDMYNLKFACMADMEPFTKAGCDRVLGYRAFLNQEVDEEMCELVSKIATPKTYIKVNILLTPAITPLVPEISPKLEDIIQIEENTKQDSTKQCILDFRDDLILAMKSIVQEYSILYPKDNLNPEQKKSTITEQKKQEVQKRKELFLKDFNSHVEYNVPNRYELLKERLKKPIVKICKDKFQKHGLITGISNEQKDCFFSELYVFFSEQMRTTLSDFITLKSDELHEDIITSYELTQIERKKVLQKVTSEKDFERLQRLADEYETLHQKKLAEENYQNLIKIYNNNAEFFYIYAKFLLRHKDFEKAEELIGKASQIDPENQDYKLIMANLLIKRNRFNQAEKILLELLEKDKGSIFYNINISFLYDKFKRNAILKERYKGIAEKKYLSDAMLLSKEHIHKLSKDPKCIPSMKPMTQAEIDHSKGPQITKEHWDDIYYKLCNYLAENSLYSLLDHALTYIYDNNTLRIQILQVQKLKFEGNYQRAVEILERLMDNNQKLYELTKMKAEICFISNKLYESEDTILKMIKLKGKNTPARVYMQLGYIYLKRKSWDDAQSIFIRSCALKSNSSLSWLGLGIACLRNKKYREAEEAFTQANIYDPFNGETWAFVALLCLIEGGRNIQAYQCLEELFKTNIINLEVLEEIADKLIIKEDLDYAEKIYLKILNDMPITDLLDSNPSSIQQKIADCYYKQGKNSLALDYYQQALNNAQSEEQKHYLESQIEVLV